MKPYSFDGAQIYIPGPYVATLFPENPVQQEPGPRTTAIIGSGFGGIPYNASAEGITDQMKSNEMSSSPQAKNYIIGGDAYYGAEFFFTPSKNPAYRAPSRLLYFRVDPATQSTAKTRNTGDTADILDHTSGRYGIQSTLLSKKIEAGSVSGYKVSVNFKGDKILVKDNVGYNFLDIQYIGAGSAATMDITGTGLTTTVTGAPTDNLSILFATVKTLGELVSLINEHTAYSCSLKNDSDLSSNYLDIVAGQDILTAAYTATADTQAVIDTLNLETRGEVITALSTGATRESLKLDTGFVPFTGGTDGVISNNDWSGALTLMEKFDIDTIVVLSGNSTIHQLVSNHCFEMSKTKVGKKRNWYSGGLKTDTFQEKLDAAVALNDARGTYQLSKFSRNDVLSGTVQDFHPFFGAAIFAGLRNANNLTMSITFKDVNIISTDEYDPDQEENIIKSGASYLKRVGSSYEVGHHISTFQGRNLIFRLPSMLETTDFMAKDTSRVLRERMKQYDRAPNDLMIKEAENYFNTIHFPGYRDNGLITNNPNNPEERAFTPVTIEVVGEVFRIRTTLLVVSPQHYGFASLEFTTIG